MEGVHNGASSTPLGAGADPTSVPPGAIPVNFGDFSKYLPSGRNWGLTVTANIAPLVALAAGCYYIFSKMSESFEWSTDQREYRQEVTTRYHRINAVVIVGGVLAAAIVAIKAVDLAIRGATLGVVFGGIVLTMGLAMALNYYAYKRSLSYDGRAI